VLGGAIPPDENSGIATSRAIKPGEFNSAVCEKLVYKKLA
jgi:hypothetical protein